VSSPANAEALEGLDAWPAWPDGRLALVGPAGTGKTHLARDWARRVSAVVIEAASTGGTPLDLAALRGRPLLVEDADRRAEGDLVDDETLFHLINMAGVDGGSLLLTGRLAPVAWEAGVPDLRSRLNALTVARISEPDDLVLEAVLRRGFEAAGIRPAADLYPYLMARLPRSAPAALAAVARWTRRPSSRAARSTRPWPWRCWISAGRRTRRTEGCSLRLLTVVIPDKAEGRRSGTAGSAAFRPGPGSSRCALVRDDSGS
jgi:chromosomal replication initiation ATPase DnaA